MRTPAAGAVPQVHFAPATFDRWPDVQRLFGGRDACGGCWCMSWRKPKAEFERGKEGGNRASLRAALKKGPSPGILAYAGGEPIGWCAVAPREVYVAMVGEPPHRAMRHPLMGRWSLAGRQTTKTDRLSHLRRLPVRKWVDPGGAAGGYQLGQAGAALEEALQELFEGVFFPLDPVRRNALPGAIHHLLGKVNHLP